MDEEAKQLLREIRDHLAASPSRYEQAIAANERLYKEHLKRMQRGLLVFAALVGAAVAAMKYLS